MVEKLSQEYVARLSELAAAGLQQTQIAEALSRSKQTICRQLKDYGLHGLWEANRYPHAILTDTEAGELVARYYQARPHAEYRPEDLLRLFSVYLRLVADGTIPTGRELSQYVDFHEKTIPAILRIVGAERSHPYFGGKSVTPQMQAMLSRSHDLPLSLTDLEFYTGINRTTIAYHLNGNGKRPRARQFFQLANQKIYSRHVSMVYEGRDRKFTVRELIQFSGLKPGAIIRILTEQNLAVTVTGYLRELFDSSEHDKPYVTDDLVGRLAA